MRRVPAYILAGGRSSRFGSDKARAVLAGEPLLLRVARLLAPAASTVTAVADRPDRYADLGLRTIADVHPGLGPLSGLHAALRDRHDGDWLLLCSCDAVLVRSEWLERLLAGRTLGAQAVAFRRDRWQPMPALYAGTILADVERALAGSRRSLHALLDRLRVIALPQPVDWPDAWQANTAGELAAFAESSPEAPMLRTCAAGCRCSAAT